jgi:hypothetical protein
MWSGGTSRSVLRSLVSRAIKVLVLIWCGRAILFLASETYRPDLWRREDLFQRIVSASIDGVRALPETVGWSIWGVKYVASLIWPPIRDELGIDLSGLSQLSTQPAPAVRVDVGELFSSATLAVALVVLSAVIATQFVVLLGILAREKTIVWHAPGFPRLSGRAKLLFGVVPMIVGAGAAYYFLAHSVWGAGIGGALGLLAIRYPILAGLPIWLAWLFGLHPRQIGATLSWMSDQFSKLSARFAEARREGQTRNRANERADDSRQRASASAGEMSYRDALSIFGLESGFDRDALRGRFLELSKPMHPDRGGSAGLMQTLNKAYEQILEHNGWRR